MDQITSLITASLLPDRQRLNFWPKYFGKIPQWMLLEPRAFAWMDRLCEAYNGGYWNYYTLSNGSVFITPDCEDNWAVFNKLNGNSLDTPLPSQPLLLQQLFQLFDFSLLRFNHLLRHFLISGSLPYFSSVSAMAIAPL